MAVDSSQSQVLPPEPSGDGATIAAVIADVTDKAALIVREEIELAKAEVSEKVTKLVKGAIIGAAAGVFAVIGLLFLVHGAAWLAWWALPAGDTHEGEFFWGYFLVAALLFVVGAIAGYIAYRAVRAGTPPVPELAIDEAKRIRETVQSPTPAKTV